MLTRSIGHHVFDGRMKRRTFFAASAAGASVLMGQSGALLEAAAANPQLRVTNIEVHEITVPYEDWIAFELNHYYGPKRRTIYVVRTNSGLMGLGESGSREPDTVLEKYIGTNPFDWVGDENSLGLGIAMYDLMGQAAGVPVYKLFGQKDRSWVPAASWTVSSRVPSSS